MGEISVSTEEALEILKSINQPVRVSEHPPCLHKSCGALLPNSPNRNPIVPTFLADPEPQGMPEQPAVTFYGFY